MATVAKTTTLPDSAAKSDFHDLVDNATVTNIDQNDIAANFSIVTISSSAPGSPATGELWFDTSAASNQGVLRHYDGAQWRQVGEGFLGYFGAGSGSIAAGALVKRDTSVASPSDGRLPVTETTAVTDTPLGVALTEMTTSVTTGIVVTHFKITNLKKATGTAVTAGDPIVPSATAGEATTNTNAAFGANCFGDGTLGIWLASAASGATTGQALITARSYASYLVALQTTPVDAGNIAPGVSGDLGSWSGSWATPTYMSLSTPPVNTVARIFRVKVWSDASDNQDVHAYVALRIRGSAAAEATAPAISGMFNCGGSSSEDETHAIQGQLTVYGRPGATDGLEVYLETDEAFGNIQVEIYEQGVILGGTVT